MKLYMKQKVFSFRDKFHIRDENDQDRYYVEGQLLSLGKKLHVYDNNGNELALIQQKLLSFLPRYEVIINGEVRASIVKELALFRNKYSINGLDWEVDGDMYDHDYVILSGGQPIVSISKAWFSWGDSYELNITEGADALAALCVVLAIDCVLAKQSSAASLID